MSDDGYLYDEDYDDFEGDLFWNDEGEIILADDLAEHTLPSPVYTEDPSHETLNGYSDWEYYSDDYYDDDPNILKSNPQGGSPCEKDKTKRPNGLRRGKKRKLAATSEIPALSLNQNSKDDLVSGRPGFEGTRWRTPPSETKDKDLYIPGMGERVGLLGDWREVFRASQPFKNLGKKHRLTTRKAGIENRDRRASSTSTAVLSSPDAGISGSQERMKILEEEDLETPRDRKRRRISLLDDSKSPSERKVVVEISGGRGSEAQTNSKEIEDGSSSKPLPNRKRKALDDENEVSSKGVSKPRAKRVASEKMGLTAKKKGEGQGSSTARSTRSKKK